MSNLLLAMLDKLGVPTEKFGDSTGMLHDLSSQGHASRRRCGSDADTAASGVFVSATGVKAMIALKWTTRTALAWAFGLALLAPAVATAQSLAGVVKDTSGAVLPGVTVEASSPGADREARDRRSPTTRPVSDRRSAARHLHGHVHAAGLRHGRAKALELTGGGVIDDQRGHARRRRRRRRSPSPARRRSWTCRPAPSADGAEQRVRARASGVARLRQLPRGRAGHFGHRPRRERHAIEQLLHVARRPQQRRQHPARRDERRLVGRRRRRVGLPVRHVERRRSAGDDRRRARAKSIAAARPSTSFRRPAATRSAAATSAASPASGRRRATSTTSCAATASPSCRR